MNLLELIHTRELTIRELSVLILASKFSIFSSKLIHESQTLYNYNNIRIAVHSLIKKGMIIKQKTKVKNIDKFVRQDIKELLSKVS